MSYTEADLRALAQMIFAGEPEPEAPDDATEPSLVVRTEGQNPATRLSDEQINADFMKRLLDEQYDLLQPQPPE